MVGNIVKQLVLEGKRVIIPNFGAFLIRDAAIVPVLTPENVSFSPFLRYNDGFLEKELVQRASVHKDEANAVITAFVDEIIAAINTQGKYGIDGLGYFYKDAKNSICFSIGASDDKVADNSTTECVAAKPQTPTETAEIHTEIKAAESVIASPSKKVEEKAAPIEKVEYKVPSEADKKIEAEKPHIEKAPKNEPNPIKKEEKEPNTSKKSRKHWSGILVSSVLAIAILLALNIFWNDIFGTDPANKRPKIILEPIEQENQVAEAERKIEKENKVQDEIDKQISSTIKEKSTKDETVEKSKSEKTVEKKKEKEVASKKKEEQSKSASSKVEVSNSYVIVLGSFGTEANAKKRLKEFTAKNISAKIVERNNMHSIVSGNFSSYDNAQKEQTRLKGLGVDGWISRR